MHCLRSWGEGLPVISVMSDNVVTFMVCAMEAEDVGFVLLPSLLITAYVLSRLTRGNQNHAWMVPFCNRIARFATLSYLAQLWIFDGWGNLFASIVKLLETTMLPFMAYAFLKSNAFPHYHGGKRYLFHFTCWYSLLTSISSNNYSLLFQ